MIWLVHEQRPNYKTIANFRKDNAKAFKEVFRYFVALLKDWNLIDGQTIVVDSFKIRAQNSLKNNFNQRKVKRHIDFIDKKRGKEKALAKVHLAFTMHDLSRSAMSIFGFSTLLKRLKAIFTDLLSLISTTTLLAHKKKKIPLHNKILSHKIS